MWNRTNRAGNVRVVDGMGSMKCKWHGWTVACSVKSTNDYFCNVPQPSFLHLPHPFPFLFIFNGHTYLFSDRRIFLGYSAPKIIFDHYKRRATWTIHGFQTWTIEPNDFTSKHPFLTSFPTKTHSIGDLSLPVSDKLRKNGDIKLYDIILHFDLSLYRLRHNVHSNIHQWRHILVVVKRQLDKHVE